MKIFSSSPNNSGSTSTGYLSHEYHFDPVNGNDSNNGSSVSPFLTFGAACTAIASAANTTEYNAVATSYYRIKMHPGITTENVTIPTRQIIEVDLSAGKVVGNITWAINGSVVSTFTQPKLIIHGTADFRSYPNTAAIPRTGINGTLTVTGTNMGSLTPHLHMSQTGVSGAVVFDSSASSFPCLFFGSNVVLQGGLTQTGSGQVTLYFENIQNSTTATSAVGQVTGNFLFNALRNVNFNGLITDGANTLTGAEWYNVAFANTSNDFTGSTFSVKADSASWSSFLASFASGKRGTATWTPADTATAVGYTPTTSANWNTVPTTVLGGLDSLAASGVAKTQSANTVLAGPTTGAAALSAFRALVTADIPAYSPATGSDWNSIPTTYTGGLDTLATSGIVKAQAANKFLASATSGGSAVMAPRAMVTADLPAYAPTTSTDWTTVPTAYNGALDYLAGLNSFNPANVCHLEDDFTSGSSSNDTNWAIGTSGTGAADGFTAGTASHPGIVNFVTGSTSTGSARMNKRADAFLFGGGQWINRWLVRITQLSTSVDEFIVRVGFQDNTPSNTVDGAIFVYDPTIAVGTFTGNTSNGTNTILGASALAALQVGNRITGTGIPVDTLVTVINGTTITMSNNATATNTGITVTATAGNLWSIQTSNSSSRTTSVSSQSVVAGTWYELYINANAAGSSIAFSIGVSGAARAALSVSPLTTNIPTAAGREFGTGIGILKNGGSSGIASVSSTATTTCTIASSPQQGGLNEKNSRIYS